MEEKSSFEVICPRKKTKINARVKNSKILLLPYFLNNSKVILSSLLGISGESTGLFPDNGVGLVEFAPRRGFILAKKFFIKLIILI